MFGAVAFIERVAVGAEDFDEGFGDFAGDEFGAEGDFGGLLLRGIGFLNFEELEQGIGVGGDGFLGLCRAGGRR